MIKAIIFDMDGVLLDSEKYWPKVNREYMASFIPEFDSAFLPKLTGRGFSGAYDFLKEYYAFDCDRESFIRNWLDAALREVYPNSQLFAGVLDFIHAAREKNLATALGTSSPMAIVDGVFATHPQLGACFDAITTGEEVGKRGKPFPDLFLKAAAKLSIDPSDCLVIEDADSGVAAGKAAGMTVYAFRNGINGHQSLKQADLIFSDFSAIKL